MYARHLDMRAPDLESYNYLVMRSAGAWTVLRRTANGFRGPFPFI